MPALNEGREIEACLLWLRREFDGEILVADGGSADGTVELARQSGARVIEGERGLARQLNAAILAAEGDCLFIVAADSRPESGWFRSLNEVFASPYVAAGGFRLKLDDERWGFRVVQWGGNFRSRYLGITLPDQGLFARKALLMATGGFETDSLIPYVGACDRLKRVGEFRLLPLSMVSSARKWREGGVFRTTAHHVSVYLKFKRQSLAGV